MAASATPLKPAAPALPPVVGPPEPERYEAPEVQARHAEMRLQELAAELDEVDDEYEDEDYEDELDEVCLCMYVNVCMCGQ